MINDIDLIPQEYRVWVLFKSRFKVFSIALSVVIIGLLAIFLFLNYQSTQIEGVIQVLQNQKKISINQQKELKNLLKKKKGLEQQVQLLNGLRGGITATGIIRTIDNAIIDRQVWFLNWQYLREGSVLKKEQQTTEVGYFIVLPMDKKTGVSDAWHIKMQIKIKGQAVDYDALSKFVLRLLNQPEIHDVRVLNTITLDHKEDRLIEFNLAVSVAGKS